MKLSKLLVVFSFLIFSSCGSVPDVPGCVELNSKQGFCKHTLSGAEFIIDDEHPYEGKNWASLKAQSVILPPLSWAAIKGYILKQCAKHGNCEAPEKKPIEDTVQTLDKWRE